MDRRSEILKATARAADVYARFAPGTRTSFDVVGAVTSMGIPLLFRPLVGLWGAAIRVDSDLRGILVTNRLDLHVQRFTLAHELGHLLLNHQTSLDASVGFAGRHGEASIPVQEIAADAFASELLAPRGLVLAAARRHGWNRAALTNPRNIYQLALRLGLSFPAMSWALVSHDAITYENAQSMKGRAVKTLKQSEAPESLITNPWADVWRLTPPDTGTQIEAGPDDLFALHVRDNSGSGFLWQLVDAVGDVEIVHESEASHPEDGAYGGPTDRVIYLRLQSSGTHDLIVEHARPWSGTSIGTITIEVDNNGKEPGGWPRRLRKAALEGIA